nr:MAG TPA: hypothetical protein [Caudoviricetes sp.]
MKRQPGQPDGAGRCRVLCGVVLHGCLVQRVAYQLLLS